MPIRSPSSSKPRSVWATWRVGGALLTLLCLAFLIPGLATIPPVDRDESRFAQASRQMMLSGDYVVPRVQDRPRLNKPPLIYWLQAASAHAFGDHAESSLENDDFTHGNIWMYRLPSAMCMLLTVLAVWRLGLRMFDPRAAMLGAVLLAVSPMLVWDAHQARADQLLLLTTVCAMRALYEIVRASRRAGDSPLARMLWPIALWASIGLGILAKGPITPMVAALGAAMTCVVLRDWRWLRYTRPFGGLFILLLMVAPWVYLAMRRIGVDEYLTIVWEETLGRSTQPAEGHWGPPGYHLVALVLLFWPGVLLTAAGVRRAWSRSRLRRGPSVGIRLPEAFLLAWAIPSWIVFEIVSTKLPHYTLPLYPALALLSARAVFAAQANALAYARDFGARLGYIIWIIVGVVGLGGTVIAIACVDAFAPGGDFAKLSLPAPVLVATAVALVTIIVAVPLAGVWAVRGRFVKAQLTACVIAVVWGVAVLGVVIPHTPAIFLSPRIAVLMQDELKHRSSNVMPSASIGLIGYHEDSLIFLTNGQAQRLDPSDPRIHDNLSGRMLVAADAARFNELPPVIRDNLDKIGSVSGFNYSTGKFMTVDVYQDKHMHPRSIP